jgi:hypothetical protein
MSDYKGDEQCADGTYDCFPTIAEEFLARNPTTTVVEQGVQMNSTDASGIPAALAAIQQQGTAQVLIFIGEYPRVLFSCALSSCATSSTSTVLSMVHGLIEYVQRWYLFQALATTKSTKPTTVSTRHCLGCKNLLR